MIRLLKIVVAPAAAVLLVLTTFAFSGPVAAAGVPTSVFTTTATSVTLKTPKNAPAEWFYVISDTTPDGFYRPINDNEVGRPIVLPVGKYILRLVVDGCGAPNRDCDEDPFAIVGVKAGKVSVAQKGRTFKVTVSPHCGQRNVVQKLVSGKWTSKKSYAATPKACAGTKKFTYKATSKGKWRVVSVANAYVKSATSKTITVRK